jgi:peptide chain release factor 3
MLSNGRGETAARSSIPECSGPGARSLDRMHGAPPDLVTREAARRRTFAIISHPDAGKTTLTEKFLLYAGAVGEAGVVKARAGRRAATSDWMEMEQKRGISITSTALQFPYRDHVVNLLDTPGHRDFSEDTYRVLAAVDAVVMVLDSAKGIEPQTLKLFEVCRSRDLPVITFLNKFDRPGREALELLDEIETQIDLRPTPATWPVGIAGDFRGVIDRRDGRFTRFTRTTRGSAIAPEEDVDPHRAAVEEGAAWQRAHDECALLDAVGADVDPISFLKGESTPVFVGSALTNFGVRHVLDAISDLAPAPAPRIDTDGDGRRLEAPCSAFVFKVQANMDRSHRDRIAFVRVCSGRFERGMVLTCERTGRPFATKYASSVFGAERSTVEEAFPGDVVGLVNATGLNIGDSLFDPDGPPVEFPPIPRFAPEVFASARPLDTGRSKQFRRGLAQLDEEGVVQVLRDPEMSDAAAVLAAVGQLQFDVFADRLDVEFGAPIEVLPAPYESIRLTDEQSAARLREIGGIRILTRGDGALVALFESRYRLQRLLTDEPELHLEPIVAS